LAQGTRIGYDTEIIPILVEDADDLAGPNAAYEPTNDKNPVNEYQFDIEDSKRQNEISLDEEGIHLTNLALMDHKIKVNQPLQIMGHCS